MSSFTKFDKFELVEGTYKKYRMLNSVIWKIGKHDSDWELELEKGFEFDISVPYYLEWFLDPHDRKVLLASAVHDKLLIKGYCPSFASSEFKRAARARGVSFCYAWVLFFTTLIVTVFNRLDRKEC